MNEYGVLMSLHTSMRVGGPASVFCLTDNESELIRKVRAFHRTEMPYFLLGNGTNVIVRDGGYLGAVLPTGAALSGMSVIDETRLLCGAGESLARVCQYAAEQGLSGLEAVSGIPGTVGGAVFMNAGAYDLEISRLIYQVRAYDIINDNIIMLNGSECGFGYRTSVFKENPMIVLAAEFELETGMSDDILGKMIEYRRLRNEKQPVDLPSAGSFFKRPEGHFAGKLIEEAGMKGARAGGAQVSEKHAGFIVNTGEATAEDVLALADEIKDKVWEKFQVRLEEEPVIIGS